MNTTTNDPPKFELSFVQLIAGCLAAITAAVIASRLGVAGTLIGTAVASIVAPVGAALYTLSIRKTHSRLQHLRPQQRGPSAEQVRRRPHLRGNWLIVAGAVVAVFILSTAAGTGGGAGGGKEALRHRRRVQPGTRLGHHRRRPGHGGDAGAITGRDAGGFESGLRRPLGHDQADAASLHRHARARVAAQLHSGTPAQLLALAGR